MKIAYLTSQYPAVSHTFVMREVHALRDIGFDIETFSVRRAAPQDCLDTSMQTERERTRSLLPPDIMEMMRACAWVLLTRPLRAARALAWGVLRRGSQQAGRLKGLAYFLEGVQLAQWLERHGFDHLHCHFGNAGSSTGLIGARLAGIPFSITCHGSELRDIDKNRLVEKIHEAGFIVCVTHYGRVQLMMVCPPHLWEKLHVVHCGAPPVMAAPPLVRGDSNSTSEILCVGRLSREKGHVVLLDALRRLRDRGVACRCTLVGDGPLRGEVESRIADLGLTDSVVLTGALAPDDVVRHYVSADVVVLASFSEGAPVVLMEAMSYGRPVVATNVGGVSELVEHGRTGTLVAPGDAGALSRAIADVLDDRDRAAAMGEAARRHVGAVFNVAQSAERLGRLFRQQGDAEPVSETLRDTGAPPC